MKRFLTLSTALLIVLVSCTTPVANADETGQNEDGNTVTVETPTEGLFSVFGIQEPEKTFLQELADEMEAERLAIEKENARLEQNREKLELMAKKLKKYVGKTWYVFAGSTPRGWDCSGLVLWYYKNLGVKLYHSANSQKYEGKPRKYSAEKAKVGDIIWFPGHVGIYVGGGFMIHSPHPGARTERVKVWDWAEDNWTSNVTYTRILDN